MRIIILLLVVIPVFALAQTACPVGVAPGSPQCGPDSGTSRGDIPAPPPRPTGEWIKTWGAIAIAHNGDAGYTKGRLTSEEAENAALQNCQKLAGMQCTIALTFHNQCAAIASPASSRGKGAITGGPSLNDVQSRATKTCEKNSGGDCKIAMSTCSDPIFRKF
ncbi:DUF4189 domain-containing protein [Xanthomonas arboricola]|uniref:DUF4189 domain-containing protein n=1 Tax=Xanthomonas arboricola TaxID=56448 RepID=UPI000C85C990|nr:DUF4189 domain-containing protein [Xanthomonas arboricola]PPU29195.1 hypothetical protein XarCFBP6762_01655 [Xanthomonas arboricola]